MYKTISASKALLVNGTFMRSRTRHCNSLWIQTCFCLALKKINKTTWFLTNYLPDSFINVSLCVQTATFVRCGRTKALPTCWDSIWHTKKKKRKKSRSQDAKERKKSATAGLVLGGTLIEQFMGKQWADCVFQLQRMKSQRIDPINGPEGL